MGIKKNIAIIEFKVLVYFSFFVIRDKVFLVFRLLWTKQQNIFFFNFLGWLAGLLASLAT